MSDRVVLVHGGLRQPGGVTVDVVNLATGLSARGHGVSQVCSTRGAARAIARGTASVVHAFGCLPTAPSTFTAMAMARSRAIPVVWTPVFHPSRRATWKGYGALRAMKAFDVLAPRAALLADAVIAATEAEARYFRSLGSARVEVIPPGVSLAEHPVSAARLDAFRRRMNLNGGPVLLTVARDNSRKALPFGLEAYERLRQRQPAVQLLLVGPDPGFPGASRPGVRCPGWLEPADVELAYRSADVLFVPSLYEALPRSVIEAWRFGVPVVATDRVALAPTIDGRGGRVIPYGDVTTAAETLDHLLMRRELLNEYGQAGQQLVEQRFALDEVVRRTSALYGELTG